MIEAEAQEFLRTGRAHYDSLMGWQVARIINNDLEWFSVTEDDGALLSRLTGQRTA